MVEKANRYGSVLTSVPRNQSCKTYTAYCYPLLRMRLLVGFTDTYVIITEWQIVNFLFITIHNYNIYGSTSYSTYEKYLLGKEF